MQSPDKTDDANTRRVGCANTLQRLRDHVVDDNSSESNIEEYCGLIIQYLHDPWSEIRKDTARFIRTIDICHAISTKVLKRLIEICSKPSVYSWQILHGSILGLSCVGVTVLRHSTEQRSAIETVCMALIGSDLLPVREAVRDCLNTLKLVDQSLVRRISDEVVERCEFDIASGKETSAPHLDGFLGMLADALDRSGEVAQAVPASIFAVDRSLLDALFLAMGHPSSTVRQRASQVYATLCRLLLDTEDPNYVGVQRLVDVIESATNWQRLEACMLVAEELMRLSVEEEILTQSVSIYPIIDAISRKLPVMLLHERYEIRRVALQALPSAARAAVLSGSPSLLNASVPSSSHPILMNESEIICRAVWISELAQSSQLLFQVSQISAQTALVEGTRDIDWVMNLPGRLTEEESKMAFRRRLCMVREREQESDESSLLQKHLLIQRTLQPWMSYLQQYIDTCMSTFKVPVDIIKAYAVLAIFNKSVAEPYKDGNRDTLLDALILCQVIRKEPCLASLFSRALKPSITEITSFTLLSSIESPQSYLEPQTITINFVRPDPISRLDLSSIDIWLCDNCAPIVICHVKAIYDNLENEVIDFPVILSFVALTLYWVKVVVSRPQCLEKRNTVRRAIFSSLPLVSILNTY